MKKNTVISILFGTTLIGGVLFKNFYSLQKRVEQDKNPLVTYSFDGISLLFLQDTIQVLDTTYLENREILSVTKSVAGNIVENTQSGLCGLTIVDFNLAKVDSSFFYIDSLEARLRKTFDATNGYKLLSTNHLKFKGLPALAYKNQVDKKHQNGILFYSKGRVISIYLTGLDTTASTYQKILESVKLDMTD